MGGYSCKRGCERRSLEYGIRETGREGEVGEDKAHVKKGPQAMLGSLSLPWKGYLGRK